MSAGSGAQERMLAELERLKQQAGMSFAQLQAAVPYSRSALHRYFTGQAAIPRDALVAVVRACDGDEASMVRMWEAAQSDAAFDRAGPVMAGSSRPQAEPFVPPVRPIGPSRAGDSGGSGGSGGSASCSSAVASPVSAAAPESPRPMRSVSAAGDGRIRAMATYAQRSDAFSGGSARAIVDPTMPLPAARAPEPVATPEPPKPAGPAEASDSTDPSPTRQQSVRAWFALAFVIVAIMAVRPLIDSSPQSSATGSTAPITDQSQDPADDPVSSADPSSAPSAVGSAPKDAPTPLGSSQAPAVPSRDASAPPEVTIVSDQDNGRILALRTGSIVEVALTGAWAKVKVNTDGSLVRTTAPVVAPWARQVEAFVVGSSGVSTSFCADPISGDFDTIPGSVCLPWPGNRPFNVTIVRA